MSTHKAIQKRVRVVVVDNGKRHYNGNHEKKTVQGDNDEHKPSVKFLWRQSLTTQTRGNVETTRQGKCTY